MTPTMKRVLMVGSGLALAVVAVVALAAFRGGCGMHGHGHGRDPAAMAAFFTARVDDALDDLDATPDQRARILAVKDRFVAEAKGLHEDHGSVHEEVLAQWKAPAPDAAKLHALVDERFEKLRALAHEAVDSGAEVHGILTPEQREKVTKRIERRMSR